jgi:hypothetical protein
LSLYRTLSPRTSKFKIAVASLGLAAAAAGSVSVWSVSAAAQPTASARPAVQVQTGVSAAGLRPASSGQRTAAAAPRSAVLDAVTAAKAPAGKPKPKHHARPRKLTPKQVARQMLKTFHWRKWQFRYLSMLWSRESSWNVHASNPYSGAYGIPQAVPGSKMASAGPHWSTSARTQIRWGMRYIKSRYGSPYWAWQHELGDGWY